MRKEYGIITSVHPDWLNALVPQEYEDDDLYEIIKFYVIYSPCFGQSAKGISLQERGWKPKPWNSSKYLKDRLDLAVFNGKERRIKMVDSKLEMLTKITSLDLDGDFFNHRNIQRALFVKSNNKGCSNEYMSLFYHIRNSLAHGRLSMYPAKNEDITFVMEDGNNVGKDTDDSFEVSARIIINKSSLLKIIEILKKPPVENDYSEDIINAIINGFCTKEKIMKELEIDDYTYNKFVQALRINGKIKFERKRWSLVENQEINH